jgi:hypothetical protein
MSAPTPRHRRARWSLWLTVAVFSILFALACYAVSGASLGLFVGGVASVAIFLPVFVVAAAEPASDLPLNALAPARRRFAAARPSVVIALIMGGGIALVWLSAVFSSTITLLQWFECVLVLLSFSAAMLGLTLAIGALAPSAASSAVIVVLAWLSWPVWMSLDGVRSAGTVAWLVWAHPIFAINAVLPQLGTWTHQPLMYQLTRLGQDVPYALPDGVVPCVAAHLAIGAALVMLFGVLHNAQATPAPG